MTVYKYVGRTETRQEGVGVDPATGQVIWQEYQYPVETLPGVPARDIDEEELALHGEWAVEAVKASPLYQAQGGPRGSKARAETESKE